MRQPTGSPGGWSEARHALLLAALYMAFAAADALLTAELVFGRGLYSELNPFVAGLYERYGVLGPLLADAMALLALYCFALAARELLPAAPRRAWLVIPAAAVAARALPVVHNVLLHLAGVETPLAQLYLHLARALGVVG